MSRTPTRSIKIAKLWLVLMVVSVAGQELQPNSIQINQGTPESVPSSLSPGNVVNINQPGQSQNARDWPLVNVDNANNKSVVDVHVPIFFDMVNQADKNTGTEKLDLSVMHGVVTVKKDKARNQNGELTGPVKVTVFGIPVYTSRGNSQTVSLRSQLDESDATKRFEPFGANLATNSSSLSTQMKAINEKLTSSLSDLLERVAGNLRRISSQQTGEQQLASNKVQAATKRDSDNEVNVKLDENRAS